MKSKKMELSVEDKRKILIQFSDDEYFKKCSDDEIIKIFEKVVDFYV